MGDRMNGMRIRAKYLFLGIVIAIAGAALGATVWNVFSPGGSSNAVQYNNAGSYQLGGAINTTATNEFLTQSNSAAPAFNVIQGSDVPAADLAASGNGGVTGTLPVANGGTGATTLTGLVSGNGASSMSAYAGSACASGDFGTALSAAGALTCALPAYPTSANPTATIGLTAVSGTAGTFMTSDSAPALSQSISPTMTGKWEFTAPSVNLDSSTFNAWSSVTAIQLGPYAAIAGNVGVPGSYTVTNAFFNGSSWIYESTAAADVLNISGGGFSLAVAPSGTAGTAVTFSNVLTASGAGAIAFPQIAASTAAQTGYLCFGSGGNLTYDTTNTCLVSSERYKTAMRGLRPADALEEVLKLQPISFRYKPQYNPGHLGTQVGFTAESVAAIDPRLAAYYPAGAKRAGQPRSVQYDHVSVILVAAMQAQQREIASLEHRVERLEERRR